MSVYPISCVVGAGEQLTKVLREWACPGGKKALHYIENHDGEGHDLYLLVFHYPANCTKPPVTMATGCTEAEAFAQEQIYMENQSKEYIDRRKLEMQRRQDAIEMTGRPKAVMGARKA